jgi:hypothetical protein
VLNKGAFHRAIVCDLDGARDVESLRGSCSLRVSAPFRFIAENSSMRREAEPAADAATIAGVTNASAGKGHVSTISMRSTSIPGTTKVYNKLQGRPNELLYFIHQSKSFIRTDLALTSPLSIPFRSLAPKAGSTGGYAQIFRGNSAR